MTWKSLAGYPKLKGRSAFISDVFMISAGAIFSQALIVLASPLLTRLYGPEDFGLFALFQSITSIFITVACLRYELAIMMPERDSEAANLLGISILLTIGLSALMIPVLWLARTPLLDFLNAPGLKPYIWMIPLAIFLGGTFNALNYWNTRSKQFIRLTLTRVTSSIITVGSQTGLALAGYSIGGGLIGGGILGSAASVIVLGGQIWRDNMGFLKDSIDVNGIKYGLRRYRKFPMIDLWSALLNALSWQIPVFLLSAFFSSTVAGFYALGFRVIQLPMSVAGNAISQVFFQRCVNAKREGILSKFVEDVFRILVILGLLPMLILAISGRDIFAFVFGENWAEAGTFAQFLGIWAFVWFISSTISSLYIVLDKQEFNLKFNIANFVTRFLSIYMGGVLHSPYMALGLFALAGFFVYGYFLVVILESAGISKHITFQIISSSFVKLIPAFILLGAIKLAGAGPFIQTITAVIMLMIYYSYIIKSSSLTRELISNSGYSNNPNRNNK